MDPGIIYGLAAALGWGIADTLGRKAARENGAATALFYSISVGVFTYGAATLFSPPIAVSSQILLAALTSALFFTLANVFFFLSMEKGDISVVSPISASFAVPVVFFSVLFFNERLSSAQLLAITIVIAGVILLSFKWSELSKRLSYSRPVQGAKFALVSALAYGAAYSSMKSVVLQLGAALTYFVFMAAGLPFYYLFMRSRREKEVGLKAPAVILGMGVVYTFANLSYAEGLRASLASVVTTISSSFPLVVALLAYFLYRERLEFNQYIGIFLVVAGVIGLSV